MSIPRREDTVQAQKSAHTREAILEATVKCYVTIGFSRTTIGTIVKESSLSRGAVAHHFESLFDLIRSSPQYIKEKRIEEFEKAFLPLTPLREDPDGVEKGLKVYWKWLLTDYAIAYYELLNVARTNTDLQKVMIPIKKAFEKAYRDLILRGNPRFIEHPEILTVTEDITQYLFSGMAAEYLLKKNGKQVKNILYRMEEWLSFVWGQVRT